MESRRELNRYGPGWGGQCTVSPIVHGRAQQRDYFQVARDSGRTRSAPALKNMPKF